MSHPRRVGRVSDAAVQHFTNFVDGNLDLNAVAPAAASPNPLEATLPAQYANSSSSPRRVRTMLRCASMAAVDADDDDAMAGIRLKKVAEQVAIEEANESVPIGSQQDTKVSTPSVDGGASDVPAWRRCVDAVSLLRGDMGRLQLLLTARADAGYLVDVEVEGEEAQPIVWPWQVLMFVDNVLRGYSQVFLFSNPITGALCCAGMFLASDFHVGLFALAANVASTATAHAIHTPVDSIRAGLFGYDAVLCGGALATFVAPPDGYGSIYLLPAAVFLGLLCSGARQAIGRATRRAFSVPALTLTFNVLILLFLQATTHGGGVGLHLKPTGNATEPAPTLREGATWASAAMLGVTQFTFVDSLVGAAFVLAGLLWADFQRGGVILCGGLIGSVTALGFAGGAATARDFPGVMRTFKSGLFGYNSCGAAVVPFVFLGDPKDDAATIQRKKRLLQRVRGVAPLTATVSRKLGIGFCAAPGATFLTMAVNGIFVAAMTVPFVIVGSWMTLVMTADAARDEVLSSKYVRDSMQRLREAYVEYLLVRDAAMLRRKFFARWQQHVKVGITLRSRRGSTFNETQGRHQSWFQKPEEDMGSPIDHSLDSFHSGEDGGDADRHGAPSSTSAGKSQ